MHGQDEPIAPRPSVRAVLCIAVVVTALGACAPNAPLTTDAPPVAPTSAPSEPRTEPPATDVEIHEWMAFRTQFGLRDDEAWTRRVADDPRAVAGPIPVLPDEFEAVHDAYVLVGDTTEKLKAYGKHFPDAYAGVLTDGRTAVVQFAADVEAHRLALESLLGPNVRFEVRGRTWSLGQLEAFARDVESDPSWFTSRGVQLFDANVWSLENRVVVGYLGPVSRDPGPVAEVDRAIREHFGAWATPEWVGPIRWEGARGDLRIRTTGDSSGTYCHTVPVDPMAGEGNVWMRPDRRGRCSLPGIPVGVYEVSVATADLARQNLTIPVVVTVSEGERTTTRIAIP